MAVSWELVSRQGQDIQIVEWLPQKREQEVTEHSNGGLAGSHESRSHRQNDKKIQGVREKSTHKVALVKTRRFQPSVDAGGTEEEWQRAQGLKCAEQ